MFDCGEGTQIQLMRSQLKAARITKIFITHLHGDHLFGLPGLMCTISQGFSEPSKETVMMLYGPVGLRKYVRVNLHLSRSELSYSYVVHELVSPDEELPHDWETWHPDHDAQCDPHHPNEMHDGTNIRTDEQGRWKVTEDDNFVVWAAPLQHRIPCFGYVIHQKPVPGKLDVALLQSKGIPPGPIYGQLKSGKTVTCNGITIKPEEVVGPPRPGKKIVILGDTMDSSKMAAIATDADIMIHEATLEDEMTEVCVSRGHSTPSMAGEFARSLNIKQLVLTHFSQRYKTLSQECEEGEVSVSKLVEQAKTAFQSDNVIAAQDFLIVKVT
ncbi:zinc phosphodiesterase ELAC protein 1-like isoform X2 [Amphiura filiformis]